MNKKHNDIVSDSDIELIWGNANFGKTSRRDVINEAVVAAAIGWPTGSVSKELLYNLGLTYTNYKLRQPPRLNVKGHDYLRALDLEKIVQVTIKSLD